MDKTHRNQILAFIFTFMASSAQYHFVTHWRIPNALPETVYDIISQSDQLPRWWPSVYLDVATLEKGGAGGLGKLVALYTKGWLPYTLQWQFRVSEVQRPKRLAITALGDFVGTGVWTIVADPMGSNDCLVTYDWQIEARKPLLRSLSWLFKPIFAANHRWAMARGEESLRLEILRRQGQTVAPPPPPTFPHNWTNNKVFLPLPLSSNA